MRFRLLVSCFIFGMAISLNPSHAFDVSGAAVVVDGDTIVIGLQIIRLHGIDTPETGQRCALSDGKSWPCGKAALEHTKKLIVGKTVTCSGNAFDEYERLIASCSTSDGSDINLELVEKGLAWAFVKFSDDYVVQEGIARNKGIGVWQHQTEAPWVFREARWHVEQQVAPNGCPIKGNISKHGQIYHVPWSRYYKKTKISVEKGERWFCSENEALKAGWRAPLN